MPPAIPTLMSVVVTDLLDEWTRAPEGPAIVLAKILAMNNSDSLATLINMIWQSGLESLVSRQLISQLSHTDTYVASAARARELLADWSDNGADSDVIDELLTQLTTTEAHATLIHMFWAAGEGHYHFRQIVNTLANVVVIQSYEMLTPAP